MFLKKIYSFLFVSTKTTKARIPAKQAVEAESIALGRDIDTCKKTEQIF